MLAPGGPHPMPHSEFTRHLVTHVSLPPSLTLLMLLLAYSTQYILLSNLHMSGKQKILLILGSCKKTPSFSSKYSDFLRIMPIITIHCIQILYNKSKQVSPKDRCSLNDQPCLPVWLSVDLWSTWELSHQHWHCYRTTSFLSIQSLTSTQKRPQTLSINCPTVIVIFYE